MRLIASVSSVVCACVDEENKFNPLQKITYVIVIYLLMPLLILSGFALLFPEIIIRQLELIAQVRMTEKLTLVR